MNDHIRFRRHVKNAQWKIAHLDFKLLEGLLSLCTATLDEQFLKSEITISDVVIKVWN